MQPLLVQLMLDCMPEVKFIYLLIWAPARPIKVCLFLGICEQLIGSLQHFKGSGQHRRLASLGRVPESCLQF